MASKRCGAAVGTAVGLAGVAAGSAFLAGTGGQVKTPALRATATAQQASSSPSSATHFAAASIVASAGAFYASSGRKVAKGNFSVTALKAFESELGVQAPATSLHRDDDTESARSRSNLGAELPVVTAREGRVALTEQTLRSHVGSLGPQPAYVPSRASLTHQPSPTVVGYSPVPPSHTSVPTVVNQLYQHQQNVLISADPALIMDTANARHAEAVRNIQSENREQILALETGAMSQVAQLKLEHAQLQSKARAFEEQANQNIHAGRQAVAQYQIEAETAAAEAEQLRQRLLSAEQTAANVVAQVETEANRRLQANQADVSARDNELSRLKGEMQEMMRIQALNMEMLQKDNAELRTRLAEAKADPLGNEPEQVIYDMSSFLQQAIDKYKQLAGPEYHNLKKFGKITFTGLQELDDGKWFAYQSDVAWEERDMLDEKAIIQLARDYHKAGASVLLWFHQRNPGGTNKDQDELNSIMFSKTWASFVDIADALKKYKARFIITWPRDSVFWGWQRVKRVLDGYGFSKTHLKPMVEAADFKPEVIAHYTLASNTKSLVEFLRRGLKDSAKKSESQHYFKGTLTTILSRVFDDHEPKKSERNQTHVVAVALKIQASPTSSLSLLPIANMSSAQSTRDALAQGIAAREGMPTAEGLQYATADREERIQAYRAALKSADRLADAMAGVTHLARHTDLAEVFDEPGADADGDEMFLGIMTVKEWRDMRVHAPNAPWTALYEAWFRHYACRQGNLYMQDQRNTSLTGWSALILQHIKDLGILGWGVNFENAINKTAMYDICHRVHILSEGSGTFPLFPASSALLDGLYSPALGRISAPPTAEAGGFDGTDILVAGDSSLALCWMQGKRCVKKTTIFPMMQDIVRANPEFGEVTCLMEWGKGLDKIVDVIETHLAEKTLTVPPASQRILEPLDRAPELPAEAREEDEQIVLDHPLLMMMPEPVDDLELKPEGSEEVTQVEHVLFSRDVGSELPLDLVAVDPEAQEDFAFMVARDVINTTNVLIPDDDAIEREVNDGIPTVWDEPPEVPASEDDRSLPKGTVGYSQALRRIGSTPKSKPDPAKHRRISEPAETDDEEDVVMDLDPDDTAQPSEDAAGDFEPFFEWWGYEDIPDFAPSHRYMTDGKRRALSSAMSFFLRGFANSAESQAQRRPPPMMTFDPATREVEWDHFKEQLGKQWRGLRSEDVMEVVKYGNRDKDDSGRFELRVLHFVDHTEIHGIRAFQGHCRDLISDETDLVDMHSDSYALCDGYRPTMHTRPPVGVTGHIHNDWVRMHPIGYHATYWSNFSNIVSTGLIPGGVTLGGSTGRAFTMMACLPQWERPNNAGLRPGAEVEFAIDLQLACLEGCRILLTKNNVLQTPDWLSNRYLMFAYDRRTGKPVWFNRSYELTRARVSKARDAYVKRQEILPVFNQDLIERAAEADANCIMDYVDLCYPIHNENLDWVEFLGMFMDMEKPSHLREVEQFHVDGRTICFEQGSPLEGTPCEWTLDAQVYFSPIGLTTERPSRVERKHYSVCLNVSFPKLRCPDDRCRSQMLDGYLHCPRCQRKLFNPSDISHIAELADLRAEAVQGGANHSLHYLAPKAAINTRPHEHTRQGADVKKSIAATLKEKCKKMVAKAAEGAHGSLRQNLKYEPFSAFNVFSKGMTVTSLDEIEMFSRLRLPAPGMGTEAKRGFAGSHTSDARTALIFPPVDDVIRGEYNYQRNIFLELASHCYFCFQDRFYLVPEIAVLIRATQIASEVRRVRPFTILRHDGVEYQTVTGTVPEIMADLVGMLRNNAQYALTQKERNQQRVTVQVGIGQTPLQIPASLGTMGRSQMLELLGGTRFSVERTRGWINREVEDRMVRHGATPIGAMRVPPPPPSPSGRTGPDSSLPAATPSVRPPPAPPSRGRSPGGAASSSTDRPASTSVPKAAKTKARPASARSITPPPPKPSANRPVQPPHPPAAKAVPKADAVRAPEEYITADEWDSYFAGRGEVRGFAVGDAPAPIAAPAGSSTDEPSASAAGGRARTRSPRRHDYGGGRDFQEAANDRLRHLRLCDEAIEQQLENLTVTLPGFPADRLREWIDQDGNGFDPSRPMPRNCTRTDAWYWGVLRARYLEELSPTDVPFVIPAYTDREVLVQHPVEQIAWFLRGWEEYRQVLRVLRAPCQEMHESHATVGFWDPLGLSSDGDAEVFARRREVELKHGRISMFATIGYIVPEYFRWPGELSPKLGLKFTDIPNGLAALTKVPGQGWGQIVAFLGTYELFINKPVGGEPGNYGKGNLGLGFLGPVADPEARKRKLSAELANGRLAMMAIIGMLFQDGLTGSAWGDWALYTDSPLRSGLMSPGYNTLPEWEKPNTGFEGLTGDQAPLGFWDPLGFSKDLDVEVFKRRRETEIKHGRVCMFATIGYIVPEYYKFDGFLSPSNNLKFSDVPNGLKALNVVPKEGWAQILAFAGFLELVVNKKTSEPGNFGKGNLGLGLIGFGNSVQDPALRAKKLNAELANGRLAMMAIIGMFFQDGLTGSAWGDWALYTDSPLRSGLMSPGYNTLPEWEKPNTGFEGLTGDQAPLGFWDPLGFSKDLDVEVFKRRRETEIKHGRVCMFATIGYIVPEYYKFDGFLSPSNNLKFSDVPNGLKALNVVPKEGWAQILAFAGFLELVVNKKTSEPGNFGKGNLGLGLIGFGNSVQDPALRAKKLNAELANGRLAMMAIIGMFFQDGLTGSAWGDWALYTDSPLRSGLMSPGYNTLPEWEKPNTGFEGLTGDQAPLGFWDPLGFSKDLDVEVFKRRRETEIKHGRVCMFATIGYIVPEYYKFDGFLSPSNNLKFSDVPNGLKALNVVPKEGWAQILAFAGFLELVVNKKTSEPGNFGKGNLGLGLIGFGNSVQDPALRAKKLNAELANGRLAMMAIIGMFFQDGLTGSAWGDWALYTDSPLRAFEGELGVQAPVGFWDPLGLSADGDMDTFKRRRAVELKHGRICMLACVGYIIPEYFRWPGYLSPEKGLKFADMPHGIAAISKVPLEGWLQIVLFIGHYEGYFWRQDSKRAPGDYEGYGFLGVGKNFIINVDPIEFQDADVKKTKLAAELANGRLAMVALMAMLFQNGTVGTTGPAMWLPAA
ncbi:FCPE [Symbiodinium sp. CCMP2592]|nr:FCPE [Symbiodinium sp. CCMP2592]